MIIRKITAEDADQFYQMLCRLDEETEYMMYEPGERQSRSKGSDFLKARIEDAVS